MSLPWPVLTPEQWEEQYAKLKAGETPTPFGSEEEDPDGPEAEGFDDETDDDAIHLYGTSEGIIKGWETRRRGGGGAEDEDDTASDSATADKEDESDTRMPPTPPHEEVHARLTKVVGTAHVPDTPTARRTASIVADTLEQMKAEGLALPDSVTINQVDGKMEGRIVGKAIPAGEQVRGANGKLITHKLHLVVDIPKALPENADMDDAALAAFGATISSKDTTGTGLHWLAPRTEQYVREHGDPHFATYDKFAVKTMRDVVVHEMGHVQVGAPLAGPMDEASINHLTRPKYAGGMGWDSKPDIHRAMLRVSVYATTSKDEFLAEAFTRLHRGETLSPDSQKLYDDLGGPKVPKP